MSDTIVQNFDMNTMADLFPDIGTPKAPASGNGFGRINEDLGPNTDIFSTPKQEASTTETTTLSPSTTETTTAAPGTEGKKEEADIFKQPEQVSAPLTDLSAYYEDRMNSGKFVKIEVDGEDGKPVTFIPKTAEEYDEVLELQIQHGIEKHKEDVEKKWYESKSPAWKAIGKYAELVDDPTQLIPFLQGVRTYQSVSGMDENDLEGAEQIVRLRLQQRNEPDEIIEAQISSLKTTDGLIKTAQSYKPLILKQEQAQLAQMAQAKEQEEREYYRVMNEIQDGLISEIEKPLFGKVKLKDKEKGEIYNLVGETEDKGFVLYSAIDQLYEKKDFNTLVQIALLLKDKEAYYNYLGSQVAQKTAESLQSKLRLAGEARTSSGNDFGAENRQPTINRTQYKPSNKFGRS